jgi:phospholipid/cholesterol/gamma-HCH transport system substrate-binding protein
MFAQENVAAVSATLSNLERFSASLAEKREALANIIENADRFFADAAGAGDAAPALVSQLEGSAKALEVMARDFTETSRSLRQRVDTGGQGVQQVTEQLIPQMQALMGDLRNMSTSIQELAEHLKENPNRLLYGGPRQRPGPGEEVR